MINEENNKEPTTEENILQRLDKLEQRLDILSDKITPKPISKLEKIGLVSFMGIAIIFVTWLVVDSYLREKRFEKWKDEVAKSKKE